MALFMLRLNALMLVVMMLLVARVAEDVQNRAGGWFQLRFVKLIFHGTHRLVQFAKLVVGQQGFTDLLRLLLRSFVI